MSYPAYASHIRAVDCSHWSLTAVAFKLQCEPRKKIGSQQKIRIEH